MGPLITMRNAFIFCIYLLLFCKINAHAEIIDKVAVIVNEEVITQREIDRKLSPVYQKYKTMYSDAEFEKEFAKAYYSAVEQMVNDKLVVSEAKRVGVEVSEGELDEQIDVIKARFNSEDEFYVALENQGISVSELKDNYKASIMARKLIDFNVGYKTTVTPVEIFVYYKSHQDEFVVPETVYASSLLIKKTENDSDEDYALSQQIRDKIINGENFSELAKRYSEDPYAQAGGDMGAVKQGEMIERIDIILFSLPEGEVSQIVETSVGYHIFKVNGKTQPKTLPFETVKDQVEQKIFNEKIGNVMNEYIKELREKAYIAYR